MLNFVSRKRPLPPLRRNGYDTTTRPISPPVFLDEDLEDSDDPEFVPQQDRQVSLKKTKNDELSPPTRPLSPPLSLDEDLEDSDDPEFFPRQDRQMSSTKAKIDELKFYNFFEKEGFVEYLEGIQGGGKKTAEITTICNRNAHLLQWCQTKTNETSVTAIIDAVLTKDYGLMFEYCQSKLEGLGISASTIKNHLLDHDKLMDWYSLFYHTHVNRPDKSAINSVFRTLRKHYSKVNKKVVANTGKSSIESAVFNWTWPKNGLPELQQCVVDHIGFVETVELWRDDDDREPVSESVFNNFMDLLFSAMYVFSPQGRVGGITELTMENGVEMLKKGFTNSSIFKTSSKYKLQPVVLGTELNHRCFTIYFNHVRPSVRQEVDVEGSPLWLDYHGRRDKYIGRRVKRFFMKHSDLNIGTNRIRSLVETTSEEMFQRSEITLAQKTAIHDINGHSDSIVKDYYLREDRAKQVNLARQMFSTQTKKEDKDEDDDIDDIDTSPNLNPVKLWPTEDEKVQADWGTEHPNYSDDKQRAEWSTAELKYIEIWKNANPNWKGLSQPMAVCLRAIKRDARAIPIFHKRHVQDSARLRFGFEKSQKRLDEKEDALLGI